MKKLILIIAGILSVGATYYFIFWGPPTPVCEGEGPECYARLSLLEIDNSYTYIVNKHHCIPRKSNDVFRIIGHKAQEEIEPLSTGNPHLLHFKVNVPPAGNAFSIVIYTKTEKAFTGESFVGQYKTLPGLAGKDPKYLKNIFNDTFPSQEVTNSKLPFCKI